MLNVIANSLMVASRVPSPRHAQEIASAHDHETARTRRSRQIAAFLAASRQPDDRHVNA